MKPTKRYIIMTSMTCNTQIKVELHLKEICFMINVTNDNKFFKQNNKL